MDAYLTRGLALGLALYGCFAVQLQALAAAADEEAAARNQINLRRTQIGLTGLGLNAQLQTAARGHSNYLATNNLTGHFQDQNQYPIGFTGTTPSSRIAAAGYPATATGEVIACGAPDGASAIEGLIAAIYHRFTLFRSFFTEQGVGVSLTHPSCGFSLVANFGTTQSPVPPAPDGWLGRYPVPGQPGVAVRFESDTETPDPEPAQNTVGYPISLQVDATKTLTVTSFTVAAAGGAALPVRLLTSGTDANTPTSAAAIIPTQKLTYGTTYQVDFSGTRDGVPVVANWEFTTRPFVNLALSGRATAAIGDEVKLDIIGGSELYQNVGVSWPGGANPTTRFAFRGSTVRFRAAAINTVTVTVTDDASAQAARTIRIGARRGDFTLDGKSDILWRHAGNGLNAIWQMNGTTLESSALIPVVEDQNWTMVGTADFNGDGRVDILWRNASTGDNAIWLMNGFTLTSSSLISSVTSAGWAIVGVGDFDGDGKSDILWRNTTTGENAIWLMNGTSVASSALIAAVSDAAWTIAGVGDFDGDGKADILWRNTSTGDTAVWLMNSFSVVSSALLQAVPLDWSIAAVADYDGDGKTDILWRNVTTGDNAIWLMNGLARVGSALIAAVAQTTWAIVGAGDYDADGKSDILWRNTATGDNAIWQMYGFALKSSALIPSVADANWRIVRQ